MRFEYGERALYNQLLYLRGLWDVDGDVMGKGKVGEDGREIVVSGEEKERVLALAEWNRERFGTCRGVVEGYLGKCGRVWVQMEGLFGFALR